MSIPKLKKVVINGVDVSDYVLNFDCPREFSSFVSTAAITLAANVNSILTISDSLVGTAVTIQRGVLSATEKYIFRGEIRNIEFDGSAFNLTAKDKLYEAIRTDITYSFDINIDDEAGVISEMFKTLINDYTSLTADGTSVQNSGTVYTLDKFVCRDTFVFERLSALAETINWQFYYSPEDDLVYFEPKGFSSSSKVLEVGNNISEVPKWSYNSSMLMNKITVRGAEQFVETTEFFNGDGTDDQEVVLKKTPTSVKVFVGATDYNGTTTRPSDDANTLKDGGKQGSTSGNYYYVYDDDSKVKKVIFGSSGNNPEGVPSNNTNNIEVRYTYRLPVPVVNRDQDSIDKYGLHAKVVVKSDIKNVSDAEIYAQKQIAKYKDVFATSNLRVVGEDDIEVGRIYNVVDNVNNIDGYFIVTKHTLSYPNTKGDVVTVGDELWKTNDWDVAVWDRLKRLEEQQTETTDLLVDIRQFSRDITYERRYFKVEIKNVAGDIGVYGNSTFGIYGTAKYGAEATTSFVLGHSVYGVLGTSTLGVSSTPSTWTGVRLLQGNNIYKEYVYDDTFYDSSSSSGVTWNTTSKEISLIADAFLVTQKLTQGTDWNYITVNFSEEITTDYSLEISLDNGVTYSSIVEGSRTAISGGSDGVLMKLTNNSGNFFPTAWGTWGEFDLITLKNTYDNYGNYVLPAIKIKFEE